MAADPRRLPFLGAGLGYRRELAGYLAHAGHAVQMLEVMPEHVEDAPPDRRADLLALATTRPVVTHGVSLSLGGAEGPDEDALAAMKRVSDAVSAPWASDHLCFTKSRGRATNQLLPVAYTDEALDALVRNVRRAQDVLQRPLAIENVTRYFAFKGEDYDEPEFVTRLLDETGALLLLDVTNVLNNAKNLGLDAEREIERYPLERAVHVHVAGTHEHEGRALDTHAARVGEDSWRLAARALERAPVRALVVERDDAFHDLAGIAADLSRARTLLDGRTA